MRDAIVFALALVAMMATPAFAQNPTHLEFPPSSDHAVTVVVNGTPINIVDSYKATYTVAGIPTSIVQDCAKPAPVAGLVACPNFPATVPQNKAVTATVTAIGPGGEKISNVSLPFAQIGPPGAPGTPLAKP